MKSRGVFLCGMVLASMAITAGAQEKVSVYNSPRAVFVMARAALKKRDVKAFMSCLTEDSQLLMTGQLVMLGMVIKADAALDKSGKAAELVKPVDEIFKKHGLTKQAAPQTRNRPDAAAQLQAKRQLAKLVKDRSAFCADLLAALQKADAKAGSPLFADAEWDEVKIDGDKATGTMLVGKKKEKRPIDFAKAGGGWLLVLPNPKSEAAKPPPQPKK
jgi:hypothetical protein